MNDVLTDLCLCGHDVQDHRNESVPIREDGCCTVKGCRCAGLVMMR